MEGSLSAFAVRVTPSPSQASAARAGRRLAGIEPPGTGRPEGRSPSGRRGSQSRSSRAPRRGARRAARAGSCHREQRQEAEPILLPPGVGERSNATLAATTIGADDPDSCAASSHRTTTAALTASTVRLAPDPLVCPLRPGTGGQGLGHAGGCAHARCRPFAPGGLRGRSR